MGIHCKPSLQRGLMFPIILWGLVYIVSDSCHAYSMPLNYNMLYNSEEVPEYEILLSPSYFDNPVNKDPVDSLFYDQVPIQYPDYYQDLSKDALEPFYDSLDEESAVISTEAPATTSPETTTTSTTTAAPRHAMRRMTKERRGMMEEPIFRPDSARDPQYMYRGRKKRSAPIPPFVQKNRL